VVQKVKLDKRGAVDLNMAKVPLNFNSSRRLIPQEQDDIEKGVKRRSSMIAPQMMEGNLELNPEMPAPAQVNTTATTLDALKAQNVE